jgi:serine/threonine-protein kinase
MSDPKAGLAEALSDRYTHGEEVGAGGMATVYRAEDIKHGRTVALKVLRPELSSAMGTDRFPREIRLIASFNHPHILSLYDSGESAGFLYYVMPFVEGETLGARLAREKELPIADTIRILIEVTDALAYAHTRGVVHRDIKPGNVLLADRHAVVADFGVAGVLSNRSLMHSVIRILKFAYKRVKFWVKSVRQPSCRFWDHCGTPLPPWRPAMGRKLCSFR